MTVEMQVEVENLKCGGCARSIRNALTQMPGIGSVDVDLEKKLVKFDGAQVTRPGVVEKLRSMGYPEKGTLEGMGAGLASARSFVSCAVGRMS